MKKYLSLVAFLSLFNVTSAMIVDPPVEKFYSIETGDGVNLQMPEALVHQCQTLRDMISDLDGDSNNIPVSMPSELLQLFIDLHSKVTYEVQDELLESKPLPSLINLFKLVDYLAYACQAKILNNIVKRITHRETLEAILKNEISIDIADTQERSLVEQLIHNAKPLLSDYCLQRVTHKAISSHTSPILSACITPDGNRLITGSENNIAKIWDIKTGTCKQILSGHADSIWSVCITSDGSKVVTGSGDKTAKIWDITTGRCEQTLSDHTGLVESVCITPNGNKVITGSCDKTAKIWDITTGRCEQTLSGRINSILSVCVTPDSNKVITGSWDKTAKIWDSKTGTCEQTLSDHTGPIWSVCVTPDGSKIITTSDDQTIKIWDSKTGICNQTLSGHSDAILSSCVTPDGNKIITGSWDATAKIWDIKTGRCEQTLSDHTGFINSVCITPDGSKVITGSWDKTVKIWNIYDLDLEKTLKYSSLKQALLCYYSLENKESIRQVIINSASCSEIYNQCDPKIQEVITSKLTPLATEALRLGRIK